jgi:hypothetical protein
VDARVGGGYRLVFRHDAGSTSGTGETFEQLDELLVTLGASAGSS